MRVSRLHEQHVPTSQAAAASFEEGWMTCWQDWPCRGVSACVLAIALLGRTLMAQAPQQPKVTIEDIEKLRELNDKKAAIERAIASLDELEKAANAVAREKETECLAAFGHPVFCSCIADSLPLDMAFGTYTVVLGKGKKAMGYTEESTENKKTIDMAYAARDKCVATAFGQKLRD
jgi:hypothetical protein